MNKYIDLNKGCLPLLRYCSGVGTQETGIIEHLLSCLKGYAPFAVEFGQRHLGGGTLGEVARSKRFSLLNLDIEAAVERQRSNLWGDEKTWTLLNRNVSPLNLNSLFDECEVPQSPAVVVVDVDGMDYWCVLAMLEKRRPALLIVEYNCHIQADIAASLAYDASHTYQKNKNYGASFRAFCNLAVSNDYLLVHVHGPMNLYFVDKRRTSNPTDFDFSDRITNLSAQDFSNIADTELFYDSFLSGARPNWLKTADPDPAKTPWLQLDGIGLSIQTLKIDDIALDVFTLDKGGEHYRQRGHKEDSVSPLWSLIRKNLQPVVLIDIGANYGFTTSLLAKRLGVRRAIAVEPDPRLTNILGKNLHANLSGIQIQVIEASVSFKPHKLSAIGLNPSSTQDNRLVAQKNWPEAVVRSLPLANLIAEIEPDLPFFIKCDTQGYDMDVIDSGWDALLSRQNWMMRFEFAPHWIENQGFHVEKHLEKVCSAFQVFEAPLRTPYHSTFEDVFGRPIAKEDAVAFSKYVRTLNHAGMGWVDLYITPIKKHL